MKKEALRGMDWVARNNLNESQFDPYFMLTNPDGEKTMTRWAEAIRNDFAARIQWSCTPEYSAANHHPRIVLNGEKRPSREPLYIKAKSGATIQINADKSSDPDGNRLAFDCFLYKEASDFKEDIKIDGADGRFSVHIPQGIPKASTLHLILQATDDGQPALTTYHRVILKHYCPIKVDNSFFEIIEI